MLKIMSHKAMQGGSNIYAYVFTYENGSNDGTGVYHGAEISYVFDHIQNDQAAQKFADQISQAWVNFAKTGVHPQTECQSGKLMTTRRVQL